MSNKLDERQYKILSKSLALFAIFVYLHEIAMIIYKYHKTGLIKSAIIEIILIAFMLFAMIAFYLGSNQYDRSIEKKKSSGKILPINMDERQKSIIVNSLACSAVIAIFTRLATFLFKFFKNRSFNDVSSEIRILVIGGLIVLIYHILNKEYDVPTTFLGKALPTGNSKKEKISRTINYMANGFKLGIVFSIFDYVSGTDIVSLPGIESKLLLNIVNFLINFIVFFTINLIWGEFNVKKYNRYNSLLDDGHE